jgi:hypothetical protein
MLVRQSDGKVESSFSWLTASTIFPRVLAYGLSYGQRIAEVTKGVELPILPRAIVMQTGCSICDHLNIIVSVDEAKQCIALEFVQHCCRLDTLVSCPLIISTPTIMVHHDQENRLPEELALP